jgi:Histidinol phosphatase and related phosphatases
VSNQSGVARGLTRWDEVNAVNAEVERRLAARGVPIAGWLVCPHHPEGRVKEYAVACRCRKPGTLLHRRRSEERPSAGRSAVVGDKWDDVGAGLALGAIAVHLLRATAGSTGRACARRGAGG